MVCQPLRPTSRRDFKIAVICALTLEAEMVELMLDMDWSHAGSSFSKITGDKNTYTTGAIAGHNIVICHLPGMGANSAAACAASLMISFPGIEVAFIVGICGVIPTNPKTREDIMLGDCIISTAIIQYDFGRQFPAGFEVKTAIEDSLSRATPEVRSIMAKLQTRTNKRRLTEQILCHLRALQSKEEDITYPGSDKDRLFPAEYDHDHHPMDVDCLQCYGNQRTCTKDCEEIGCEIQHAITRIVDTRRKGYGDRPIERNPKLFFGRFGSANKVIKAGIFRDKIAQQHGLIAFEMEGSGTWEILPTIIIKGASDYADSHKNKAWQTYAAAVAASCLKAVLTEWTCSDTTPRHEIPNEDLRDNTNINVISEPAIESQNEADRKPDLNLQRRMKRREQLLDSLYFEDTGNHGNSIRERHLATCDWLLDHELYKNWLDDIKYSTHRGVFYIRGKAGSGKSTLMKFALAQAEKASLEHQGAVIISFFFHARGGAPENTTLGMYQSLLRQLLQKILPLQEILDDESLHVPVKQFEIQILENLLCSAIQMIAQLNTKAHGKFRIMCFVDALDECDEDQIREMLRLFEKFGDLSQSTAEHVSFRVCFSSRHYPNISLCIGLEIVLEKQKGHLADIERYIEAKLRIGTSQEGQLIKAELSEKSGQIFLWVVLVIEILVREYDRGRLHALRNKLREIPRELDKLFQNIILRDRVYIEELLLCIRCILYAKRPLSLNEFYFVMMSGVSGTSSNHTEPWYSDQVTMDDMEKFVISSSKGLAEVTQDVYRRVQFIHESVREFLVNEQARVGSWLEIGSIAPGPSHDHLKALCESYFNGVSLNILHNKEKFPFLEYAIANVARHAEEAETHGISQLKFLEEFALYKWLSLKSVLSRKNHTAGVTFLYILAEYNLPMLIRRELTRAPSSNLPGNEIHELPIYAAMARQNVAAVQELLKPAPDPQIDSSEFSQAVLHLCTGMLSQPPNRGQTFVSYLAECWYPKLAGFLLSSVAWRDLQEPSKLLHLAVKYRCNETLRSLVYHKDLDVDTRDPAGRTALYIAARSGYSEVVQTLVQNYAAIEKGREFKDWEETPLLVAARYGHESTLTMLCELKANFNATYRYGATALHMAAVQGHVSAISTLVRYGLRPDIRNQNGWLPLHVASYHGQLDVVKYLLSLSVNSNVETLDGYTPLWLAGQCGHKNIVDLLIQCKAEVNHTVVEGWTVLHAAIISGSITTTLSLVEAGASLNATTSDVLSTWPSSGFSRHVTKPDDAMQSKISSVKHLRPLHLAMLKFDLKMITLLVNLGSALECTDLESELYKDLIPEDLSIVEKKPLEDLHLHASRTMKQGWPVLKKWIWGVAAQYSKNIRRDSLLARQSKASEASEYAISSAYPGDKAPIYYLGHGSDYDDFYSSNLQESKHSSPDDYDPFRE